MGYYLQAFIGRQADTHILTNYFDNALNVEIGQRLGLVPMTEALHDQINNLKVSDSVGNFQFLTVNIEKEVLTVIGNRKMAYVEAEYFGGEGGQKAIVWNNGKREMLLELGQGRINQVLKDFGVKAFKGQDEFSALKLDRHRRTEDWLEDAG